MYRCPNETFFCASSKQIISPDGSSIMSLIDFHLSLACPNLFGTKRFRCCCYLQNLSVLSSS
uniref:Uncharacterized protein n=1 Tax=Arundo donax TaxID=35708 RepID=A0A0A9C9E6_ARUDO